MKGTALNETESVPQGLKSLSAKNFGTAKPVPRQVPLSHLSKTPHHRISVAR